MGLEGSCILYGYAVQQLDSSAFSFQDVCVLEEDYTNKLLRQQRYYEQKRRILRLAAKQAAWHKALELGLAAEVRSN